MTSSQRCRPSHADRFQPEISRAFVFSVCLLLVAYQQTTSSLGPCNTRGSRCKSRKEYALFEDLALYLYQRVRRRPAPPLPASHLERQERLPVSLADATGAPLPPQQQRCFRRIGR